MSARKHDHAVGVEFTNNAFVVDLGEVGQVQLTSDLALDESSSKAFTFEVLLLAKKDIRENQIFEIWTSGKKEARIGWLVPANALTSDQHDFATNPHFLKYAFSAIQTLLVEHPDAYRDELKSRASEGTTSVPFSDLFHDNVCLLVTCKELARAAKVRTVDALIPSLVACGYVPLSHCVPEGISWIGQETPANGRLKLRPTGEAIQRADLPARLFSISAGTADPVARFFYLYQVVELLLEEVLLRSLADVGRAVSNDIAQGRHLALRDQLEGLSARLGEKGRLKTLMQSFPRADSVIEPLSRSADRFLELVDQDAKGGIESVYQVRNFVVHQVRHMPSEADQALNDVVVELAGVLPSVLSTFRSSKVAGSIADLNEQYATLAVEPTTA